MNFLSGAEISCPLSVLQRVRIIEVIFTKHVWTFSRDQVNCPYQRSVRIREVSVRRGSTVGARERIKNFNATLGARNISQYFSMHSVVSKITETLLTLLVSLRHYIVGIFATVEELQIKLFLRHLENVICEFSPLTRAQIFACVDTRVFPIRVWNFKAQQLRIHVYRGTRLS